jgi:hypothetical protein
MAHSARRPSALLVKAIRWSSRQKFA